MHIPVIFEDNNILVIDKPSGIVVHPYDFSEEETLVTFLMEHSPEVFDINNEMKLQDGRIINLGGIVHKLDRDTSGVMIVAKNQNTFDLLQEEFRNHQAKKEYLAVVEGIISEDTMIIDAPLGRNKKDYKQIVNPSNPRGELREAITHVEVIKRYSETTLVELKPITGRTHQLRAHMNYIGHPIVGDKAYGSKHEAKRIMLHAHTLTIQVGIAKHTFMSDTPADFIGEHKHTHECH